MTTERSGRRDAHANVSYMKWAEDQGSDRRAGIRVGYGNAFCWIPEDEVMRLANELVDYIAANNINTNA